MGGCVRADSKFQDVLVYAGYGSSYRFLAESLPRDLDARHKVCLVTAEDVRKGIVFESACAFFMPGGEERFYLAELGQQGNGNLQRFVEQGGQFFGVCGGAYHAASMIRYHSGRQDEVIANRPLGFFKGCAEGSIEHLGPFYDRTLASAVATTIQTNAGKAVSVFYHGGPKLIPDDASVRILARYAMAPGQPPAIVHASVGDKGGMALLSGVHLELSSRDIEEGFKYKPGGDSMGLARSLSADDRLRRGYWRGLLLRMNLALSPRLESNALKGSPLVIPASRSRTATLGLR